MDIQTTKLELLKVIIENENSSFLKKISDFLKAEQEDFWDDLNDLEKSEIKQGIEELNMGKRVSYDSFIKKQLNNFIDLGA